METLLAEQPTVVSCILAVAAGALFYGWLQSGKREAAIIGVVFAALIPVAWLVADRWETDREQIESLIRATAAAVERNDVEAAVKIIASPELRGRARAELSKWTFKTAAVNKIRSITMIEGTIPQEADVDMSVKVDLSQQNGLLRDVRVLRRLFLRLEKSGDTWVVTDYLHSPITGTPDRAGNPNFPSATP